jgi:hypothetical protein
MPDTDTTLTLIDGAIRDWETSPDAMRWNPDRKPGDDQSLSYDEIYELLQRAHDTLIRPLASYLDSVAAGLNSMFAAIQPLIADEVAHNQDAALHPRWHRRRCARCNPRCYTPPTPGGAEYHRRLKARARRRRRR